MLLKTFKSGKLDVRIYDSRKSMGQAAADDVAACIRDLLSRKDEIRIIFAAAPSQNEFLEALVSEPGIEWNRIHALHMDEYVGLPADAPQGFGNFLKAAIFGKVPFAGVDYIGSDVDPDEACRRYTRILDSVTVDMVCMGIGENGHIAFNDPAVADFHDSRPVKVVSLDDVCRMQQVHDKCFPAFDDVPAKALTVTIPELVSARKIFCIVPTDKKAEAVKNALTGPVAETCPASILRTVRGVSMYIDRAAASLL